MRQIPALEGGVAAVALPDFTGELAVQSDFGLPVVFMPVVARIVQAEIELKTPLVSQPEEQFRQVGVDGKCGHVLGNARSGERQPLAPAGADQDHGIQAGRYERVELALPLLTAPVVRRYVMRHLVDEGAGDGQRHMAAVLTGIGHLPVLLATTTRLVKKAVVGLRKGHAENVVPSQSPLPIPCLTRLAGSLARLLSVSRLLV